MGFPVQVRAKMSSENFRIGFIGAGRLAQILAPALHDKGYLITSISSRSHSSAVALSERIPGSCVSEIKDVDADLIFITTSDSAISEVASNVYWNSRQYAVHCSGASSLEKLHYAKRMGASVGSWHPYQTFNKFTSLEGVTFGIQAEVSLTEILREMTLNLGGIPIEIPSDLRPLYHASSVMSCGYLATLIYSAALLWTSTGLSEEKGFNAILKIARSTLDAIEELGVPSAMTGPIIRGDKGTVNLHKDLIERHLPSLWPFYEQISLLSVMIAQENGISDSNVDWSDIFRIGQEELQCD